ncbi:MAG: hypothetical protein MJZ99_10200 [Bacteroidales bacterium]|nr:hypothetical protein [Bacteroidales bacterium]
MLGIAVDETVQSVSLQLRSGCDAGSPWLRFMDEETSKTDDFTNPQQRTNLY